jgi:hypothetical protein
VSIDLGDAPVGTPPTAEQSNQIRTALDIFQEPSIIGEELDLIGTDEPYTIFGDMLFFDEPYIEILQVGADGSASTSSIWYFVGSVIEQLSITTAINVDITQAYSISVFYSEGGTGINAAGSASITNASLGYNSSGTFDFSNCINLVETTVQENVDSTLILDGCSSLTNLTLNSSATLDSLSLDGCTSLIDVDCIGSSLSQSIINYIVMTLDSLGQEDGFIDLSNNTYQPTGDGATAVTNLIAKGWTVILNA